VKYAVLILISLVSFACQASSPQPMPSVTIGPIPPVVDVPATVNLSVAWDLETDPQVTGYRVYRSLVSGQYTFGHATAACEVSATVNTCTFPIPSMVTNYFVATALNMNQTDPTLQESAPSNEISYKYPAPLPSPSPGGLRMMIVP